MVDWRAAVAEFVAMLLFVFICVGAAAGTAGDPARSGTQQIALTFGFAITCLAYTIGHISGGHINCAVTFGLVMAGEVGIMQGVCNFLAQLSGSIAGAALVALCVDKDKDLTAGLGTNALAAGYDWHQGFVAEILMTFLLMYVVLQTAVNPASGENRSTACIAIGFAVYIAHSVLIPITGCSINPSRSFGPAIVASIRYDNADAIWKHHWIFWVGPLIGSLLAVLLYKVTLPPVVVDDTEATDGTEVGVLPATDDTEAAVDTEAGGKSA